MSQVSWTGAERALAARIPDGPAVSNDGGPTLCRGNRHGTSRPERRGEHDRHTLLEE